MTTEEIRQQITAAKARVGTDERIPADWIEAVFEGIVITQQVTRSGWLVIWPFANDRMLLAADADSEEVERRIVRALERTARNWDGD